MEQLNPGGSPQLCMCRICSTEGKGRGMQQRILHGVMAVKAFIPLLNHDGSSQGAFFFSCVLWTFSGLLFI